MWAARAPGASLSVRAGRCPSWCATPTGVDVYPGHEVLFCPEDTGGGVGPHSSVSGSFRWSGEEDLAPAGAPARWQQAPPGRYSLEVAGTLEVPFTLAG